MSNLKNNNNTEKSKLNKKDLAIVILSVLLLAMLILIVFQSRRRDQMISQRLQNDSEVSTDDAIAAVNSNTFDYIEITEVSAENWIEIHNKSSETIDISGLIVKVSDKQIATADAGTRIEKDGYYVIDLSLNPWTKNQNVMTLYDADGNAIKSLLVPNLNGTNSYGLADAEKNIWGFMKETRGKANLSDNVIYLQSGGITMSAPGGFYDSSFQLELGCEEGEKIYYTTDGNKPTTESDLYEEPIYIKNNSGSHYVYALMAVYNRLSSNYVPGSVDVGTTVRAIRVDASGSVVGEFSQTYFVGLSKDSDYLNLPVISITTDPENLFDYENGIYVAGKVKEDALIQGLQSEFFANYLNYWTKPVKIDYYEPTKNKTFVSEAIININNDSSIAGRQKGFEISINGSDYSDIAGSTIADFISSEGKIRLTTNYSDDTYKIRNLLVESLIKDTDLAGTGCSPCVVFLEGEYWGLYMFRPYVDSKYIEQKYGLKNQEIITHSGNAYNESFRRLTDFAASNDLSQPENYRQIQTMMDVDNFINYVCFNMFVGNSSFIPQNGLAWRTSTSEGQGLADGRWRFILGDMASTMYISGKETPTINSFLQPGVQGDILFQSLLMNEEFCKKLESRMTQMVENEYTSDMVSEKLDEVVTLIKKPAIASHVRFDGTVSDGSYMIGIENIRAYFAERSEYIIKYTKELAEKGGDLVKAREIMSQNIVNDETIDEETESAENAENDNPEEGSENNEVIDNTEGQTNG